MEGRVPNELLRMFQARRPEGRSLLVESQVGFSTTTFLAQLADELGEPFLYDVNYVNIRDTVRQLCDRFPCLRRHFEQTSPYESWLVLETRRKAPREQLRTLIELIVAGVGDKEFSPSGRSNPPRESLEPDTTGRGPERISVIPEFEGIYEYVDRANHVPAMVLIDSLGSLARHYGISQVRLAYTLQRDLVDTGFANVVASLDGDSDPVLETVFDGVVGLKSLYDSGGFPWALSFQKLPGADLRQRRYVLFPRGPRLVALSSDRDAVEMLLGERPPDSPGGFPREFVGFLGESRGPAPDGSTLFGGSP